MHTVVKTSLLRNARTARTLAFVGACTLIAGSFGCEGRAKSSRALKGEVAFGPEIAVIDLEEGAPEGTPSGFLGVPRQGHSFYDLLITVGRLGNDSDVRGVFVRFGGELGFARGLEFGEAMQKLRKTGKTVHCHAAGLTNGLMLAAALACDSISVPPAGEVETVGIGAQIIYLRKLLSDELKVSVDILQVGKYKGAEEPLTRDGPSDEARSSLEGVLADLRTNHLNAVVKGRGQERVREALEDGPYSPNDAKERGLIDAVAYEDDAIETLKKKAGATRVVTRFGHGAKAADNLESSDLVRSLAGDNGSVGPVALVRAIGSITMGDDGGGNPLGGNKDGITDRGLGRTLLSLENDDDVKAVVLRIDSPGGSALASDLLWHRLMALRKKKKLVVSIGDMAASGGYYLASTADVIFAEPVSIVGSIGVVGGKVGIGTALERFGIHAETFPAKKGDAMAQNRVAYMSPFVPWDAATKGRVLASMQGVYSLFLARVSEGRGIPVEKVAESAEGQIFSGQQGLSRKLVDEVGGLEAALAKARALAGLPGTARVSLIEGKGGFLQSLAGDGDSEARAQAVAAKVSPDPMHDAFIFAPGVVEYVRALAPLAEGERALCALPYAVKIR